MVRAYIDEYTILPTSPVDGQHRRSKRSKELPMATFAITGSDKVCANTHSTSSGCSLASIRKDPVGACRPAEIWLVVLLVLQLFYRDAAVV